LDYQKFFSEVSGWINQSNQMAMKHGLNSDDFWNWVTSSIGEMCTRYKNNPLVVKQMAMLFEWLEEVYERGRKQN
jgi:hypothetical protein